MFLKHCQIKIILVCGKIIKAFSKKLQGFQRELTPFLDIIGIAQKHFYEKLEVLGPTPEDPPELLVLCYISTIHKQQINY